MKALPVKKYDLDGNLLATYKGLREASRLNNINPRTLADHIVSNTPYIGFRWEAPSHMQSKAERNERDRKRKERRLREALETNHHRDMENLLALLHEPHKAIVGHLMQQALDEGGSPRHAFAKWYIHQSEIFIDSDDIVDALYPNGRPHPPDD